MIPKPTSRVGEIAKSPDGKRLSLYDHDGNLMATGANIIEALARYRGMLVTNEPEPDPVPRWNPSERRTPPTKLATLHIMYVPSTDTYRIQMRRKCVASFAGHLRNLAERCFAELSGLPEERWQERIAYYYSMKTRRYRSGKGKAK